MGLVALWTHLWKDVTSPGDRRVNEVVSDRRNRRSSAVGRVNGKSDLHYGILTPKADTRRRMRGDNGAPDLPSPQRARKRQLQPQLQLQPEPVPESCRHRFHATCFYTQAKLATSETDRRKYAKLGLAACRRACEEMRREGRRPYAATYDVAELALLADDPGAAYAAACEVVAASGISDKLRANAATVMELAFVRLHLPLPKIAYA